MDSHYDISKNAHTYSIWTPNLVDSAQTPVASWSWCTFAVQKVFSQKITTGPIGYW